MKSLLERTTDLSATGMTVQNNQAPSLISSTNVDSLRRPTCMMIVIRPLKILMCGTLRVLRSLPVFLVAAQGDQHREEVTAAEP